jgi:hypothetical protein
MKVNWRTVSKWLLVLPAFALSTFAAVIGIEFSILFDRPALALASSLHINIAPSLILRPLDLLIFFAIILIWILPPVFAVGFALRTGWISCWQWGFTISFLLLAAFDWYRPNATITLRWVIVCASALLILEGLASARRVFSNKTLFAAQGGLLAVLLLPYFSSLLFAQKLPPEPRKVWSAVLQKETWQAMNTGSEYAATRQMVFAGDRLVVVFDSKMPFYEGKQPMSTYRVLSLDQATGTVRNQMEFTGRWGAMPYIFATNDDQLTMQNGPVQRLKPNLVAAEDISPRPLNSTPKYGNFDSKCDLAPHFLAVDRILSIGCGNIRILNDAGKVIVERQNREDAFAFAGVNLQATRFALQASDERGDPSFLLYERFFIYDTKSVSVIATISINDLPERQSWTAFSPDGRFFAVGNPNKLSMYELP